MQLSFPSTFCTFLLYTFCTPSVHLLYTFCTPSAHSVHLWTLHKPYSLPVFLASPPSKACAMRSPASSEQRDRPSGLLCGRLLVALVESVLRPGGWENVCRLKCHCVRHIDVDNKHGRSVKAIHSFLSRWKACTELCAGTQKSRAARRARWGARTVRFSGVA